MKTIRKEIKAAYCDNTGKPLIQVSYHKLEDMFLIFNDACVMEVDRQDIPALIAMLQSVSSGVK